MPELGAGTPAREVSMDDTNPDEGGFTRRSVLRRGATAAGAAVVGAGALSGTAAADEHDGSDEKRGGRGRMNEEPDRNTPFRVEHEGAEPRPASCMSEQSAEQVYLRYNVDYCGQNDDGPTLWVIPDEAPLATGEEEVYQFRSHVECRDSDDVRVAFGPSNQECE